MSKYIKEKMLLHLNVHYLFKYVPVIRPMIQSTNKSQSNYIGFLYYRTWSVISD